jgi:hypothetical protein
MKHAVLLPALLLSVAAFAATPPKTRLLDFSNEHLIGDEAAKAVMAERIPAKVWKIYPASKWVFLSQVSGGITPAGACVITARVMLLPLTPTMKAVLLRPEKIITTFDSQTGLTLEACQALGKSKLVEATDAMVAALIKV